MRKVIFLTVLSLAGAALNIVLNTIFWKKLGVPVYLDTIFTITVTLAGGPFWGVLTGALTNIVGHSIDFWGWEGYLFTICNIATALITTLFMQRFPHELSPASRSDSGSPGSAGAASTGQDSAGAAGQYSGSSASAPGRRNAALMDRLIVLILFSFVLCLAMSILGGLIATFIQYMNPSRLHGEGITPAIGILMFPDGFSIALTEILSRIPQNIIDRLISVFAGFGLACLIVKGLKIGRRSPQMDTQPETD